MGRDPDIGKDGGFLGLSWIIAGRTDSAPSLVMREQTHVLPKIGIINKFKLRKYGPMRGVFG